MRNLRWLGLWVLLGGCALETPELRNEPPQQPPSSAAFTLAQARHEAQAHAHELQSARAEVQARQLQREALAGLNGPWVFLSADALRYHAGTTLKLDDLHTRIQEDAAALEHGLAQFNHALPIPLPTPPLAAMGKDFADALPNRAQLERRQSRMSLGVHALWPLYTGGRLGAVQSLAAARAEEAKSDFLGDQNRLNNTLTARYFGVQMARAARDIRREALHTIAGHLRLAQGFLRQGLIAKVDYLKARAAYAGAQSALAAAQNRLDLARAALKELTHDDRDPITPLAPPKDLHPLAWYQQQALKNYPGFAKIRAKERELDALQNFTDSFSRPSISLYGSGSFAGDKASALWLVGVHVGYTLWSGVDRKKMSAAAQVEKTRLEAVRGGAQADIQLLVEKNYLALQDALNRYRKDQSRIALAREQLRLAQRSFAEGLATALDAMDAATNLAKIRTERAKAAYEAQIAAANLKESAGLWHMEQEL